MKGYICAILLLMCGMAHSGPGGCLYGSKRVTVGRHTIPPCMEMICDRWGRIITAACPSMTCNPWEKMIAYTPEKEGPDFPYCCPQPVCESIRNNPSHPSVPDFSYGPYGPYALPQVGFE